MIYWESQDFQKHYVDWIDEGERVGGGGVFEDIFFYKWCRYKMIYLVI